MRILALECSSVSASAAVTENGVTLGADFVKSGLTHSQTLMPMLEKIIKENNISLDSIDVFACTAGPGSFTGVRIGVAAIKGLADAKKKPCFALSTPEVIAYAHRDFDGIVCSVMDARCNQVYTACFEGENRITPDEAILIDELKDRLLTYGKPILFSGDGAGLVYSQLKDVVPDCSIADEADRYPTAENAAKLTEEKLLQGEKTVEAEKLLPVYLRVPQAQRELNKKNNKKGDI
jgi:tRNA threonylcarbamoyladenosine biosynthesis protein TsaB